ncbi:MAG: formate dehydrogenase accessory sulfurtransferase FdhD [Candidatus Heimdallarchaeota archaeon]
MYKRKINITKIHKDTKNKIEDVVLVESPIDLYVNSEPLVNIICLPKALKELAVGFLFSIGLIEGIEDIKAIKISDLETDIFVELRDSANFDANALNMNPVGRVVDTSCGIPSPWRNIIKDRLDKAKVKDELWADNKIKIESKIIFSAIKKMQLTTPLYRETGGCHGAAIFDLEGTLLSVKEDIGRHNAIDKVIGDLLIQKHSFENVFLTSTGRLTSDSVLKAIRARIPILASFSAAIESGIKLAFAYGITLIGFARGGKMNIYTHPERIII